jgi:hypothetical protein
MELGFESIFEKILKIGVVLSIFSNLTVFHGLLIFFYRRTTDLLLDHQNAYFLKI